MANGICPCRPPSNRFRDGHAEDAAFQPEAGPTSEHRAPAELGHTGDALASAASESPLTNLKASLASGVTGASPSTTGVEPRAHQTGSAKGAVKAEVHAADATTLTKAATKAVTRQQHGAAEALVDPPAEGASLTANLHQNDGQLATEGLGSSRQNLYVVEGGRSSKSDANAETEDGGNGVPSASENLQLGEKAGAMAVSSKGSKNTLPRADLKHGDEPIEMESDQGLAPAQDSQQAVSDESFDPRDVAWFKRFSAL